MILRMNLSVCERLEKEYRDSPLHDLESIFPSDVHFPLYVHLIQAFGYREEWAASLLEFIRFDSTGRPYFPKNPETPEAHRHKFLCALTLWEGSPEFWEIGEHKVRSEDFVEPILEGPLADWGDDSIFPEPSWTLQFLSVHLDQKGFWKGKKSPLAEVSQACLIRYYRDYDSGNLYERGKTLFTESGLHLLEAINKLCKAQNEMIVEPATESPLGKFFPPFKDHFFKRLADSMIQIEAILRVPGWQKTEGKERALGLALSNLLVSGHLLETAFHPRGALRDSFSTEERDFLKESCVLLESLMVLFFEPDTLVLMNEEKKKAYHFPLFHAYRALQFARR